MNIKNIILLLFGLITSVGMAFVNYYIQEFFQISLFTFSFWFVVPIGAIAFGALAVSGYYGGALLINKLVNKYDLMNKTPAQMASFLLDFFNKDIPYIKQK